MEMSPKVYGFRYRYAGHNWALAVAANSPEDAKARVFAIADAWFVAELQPEGDTSSTHVDSPDLALRGLPNFRAPAEETLGGVAVVGASEAPGT
jgi:hypothetical protein